MFGALNRLISRLDSEPLPQQTHGPGDTSYGFQILRNTNPDLPLEPWFDFIVGINGRFIDSPDPNLFSTEIRNCAGGFCSLDLWNAKGQRTNTLTVPVPPAPQSLGLSLQLAALNSTQNIWHILSIPSPLSPAHAAGLLPHSDYILGTPSGTLRGEAALGELVEDHLNRSLVLWVYNSEFDVVREVELIPRRGWGGEGALGAVLGFGALHRIPVGLGEEVQGPGENLFDADRKSVEYAFNSSATAEEAPPLSSQQLPPPPMIDPRVAPPPLLNPSAPTTAGLIPSTASKPRKGRQHAAALPTSGFDDMFEEGAKKSAEQDFVSSRKGMLVAPPPKVGAPPTVEAPTASEGVDAESDQGEPAEAEVD